jgi:hypothetical protein
MAKHSAPLNQNSSLPSIKEGLGKKQVHQLADESVGHVLEEGNVFQVAEALAAMEEFVKTVRKDERYVQFLRDELVKHHGRLVTHSGAKVELCEAGVSYDYSNNAEWNALDEEIRFLSERKKILEETLRKLEPGRMAVDPETGEVFEGPMKTSRSTYRITLAK